MRRQGDVPRDKTCGDGLTANALRRLEQLGLRRDDLLAADAAPVRDTVLVSPSGRHVVLPMPDGGEHAAVVTRSSLDAALVAHARRCGVELREDCEISRFEMRADGVQADDIWASHVIAADGHWSPVRRMIEPTAPADLGEWHAVRQYFECVAEARLVVAFERDLLPGYAWLFPLAGGARERRLRRAALPGTIGQGAQSTVAGPARSSGVAEHARPFGAPVRTGARLADPDALLGRALRNGRVLFAGDAAGVVDPMTGEGIAQALETGMLAAESIASGRDYARLVHRTLGRDLRFSHALQALLRRDWERAPRSAPPDCTPWTRRNFARWIWEDYPRALVLTPDRWRRGAFSAAGAWPARTPERADAAEPRMAERRSHVMAEGKAEVAIDRSPDDIWKLVREFGDLDQWMPGVERAPSTAMSARSA